MSKRLFLFVGIFILGSSVEAMEPPRYSNVQTEKLLKIIKESTIEGGRCFLVGNHHGQFAVEIKECLEAGADPNACYEGIPLLYIAARLQTTDLVRYLLDAGAHLDCQTEKVAYGRTLPETPLFIAVEQDNDDIVKLLVERGASPNIARGDGVTPLSLAVERKQKARRAETDPYNIIINAIRKEILEILQKAPPAPAPAT